MADKSLTHEILADIKRVAHTLGRTPSRDQYIEHGSYYKHQIDEVFGNYTSAIMAAGMSTRGNGRLNRPNKQEARLKVFEKIKEEAESKRLPLPPRIAKRALFIGDLHAPYHHPDAIPFLIALHEKYNFDYVACVGDEVDNHAISFHDADPDLLSAGHELEAAIKALEPLYKVFPIMDIAESNHGSLVYRKGKHHGLPRQVLKSYKEILRTPEGWNWHFEFKVQFSDGKTVLINHSYGNILKASKNRGMSLIGGHIHTEMCVQFWSNYDSEFFGMQTGCLIDPVSLAFAYNKTNAIRPLLGSGGYIDGQPRIFPMQLDANGRWNGVTP